MVAKSLIFLTATVTSIAVAHAQEPQVFSGAGQESEIECDGGALTVEGASNILDISGDCSVFRLEGASNRIRVSLAANARLIVVGADNEVVWTTTDGKRPRASITGAGNRISKGR